jgi:hypothetical protein
MMSHKLDKFAAFILTHGRPNDIYTYRSLQEAGYTGKIYFVIDNEDKTEDEYRRLFGSENVIQFDKAAIGETFDIADTRTDRRAIVYARNASFEIAKQLGLDYFIQLDDDYTSFMFRWADGDVLKHSMIKNMDEVLEAMIQFVDDTGTDTFAMAQGGDFIGGVEGSAVHRPLMRKAMNSFIFRTDSDLRFKGRMNEDVNIYVGEGMRGRLIFTTTAVMLTQRPTQGTAGGMTEMYLETGTYMKSMYTVMMCPSCVTVRQMGPSNPRLHHSVRWDNAVPKIISDRYRKG